MDVVLKFRMLVLQSLHGLSLDATEKMVRDRLNCMPFCGLGIAAPVPDANTLWDFREALIKAEVLDDLFQHLDHAINTADVIPRSGQTVDASLVAAPKQRNTDGEKEQIKAGQSLREIWPDKPAKAAQKDTNAHWTGKYSKAKTRADGKPQNDIAITRKGTIRPAARTHVHKPPSRPVIGGVQLSGGQFQGRTGEAPNVAARRRNGRAAPDLGPEAVLHLIQ